MIKFIRSLFRNKLKERVEALEREVVVKEKYENSPFARLLNCATGPDDTIGNRVKKLEDFSKRDIYSDKVRVSLYYDDVDEDGDQHECRHTMKLSDVITLLLDHCGLEILPPKQEAGIVAKKKK